MNTMTTQTCIGRDNLTMPAISFSLRKAAKVRIIPILLRLFKYLLCFHSALLLLRGTSAIKGASSRSKTTTMTTRVTTKLLSSLLLASVAPVPRQDASSGCLRLPLALLPNLPKLLEHLLQCSSQPELFVLFRLVLVTLSHAFPVLSVLRKTKLLLSPRLRNASVSCFVFAFLRICVNAPPNPSIMLWNCPPLRRPLHPPFLVKGRLLQSNFAFSACQSVRESEVWTSSP